MDVEPFRFEVDVHQDKRYATCRTVASVSALFIHGRSYFHYVGDFAVYDGDTHESSQSRFSPRYAPLAQAISHI